MKIEFCPTVQRHLRVCPNASIKVLQIKAEVAYFARCLLMPEDFVKSCWIQLQRENKKRFFFFNTISNYYTTFRNIKTMAKILAVPVEEMQYRLKELGLIM